MRLDFLVTKGPLVPSNSTICPRNGPKRRQKAPKTAPCAPAARNQDWAVSWTTWLQTEFRGHLVHPQPPTFYGFQASELPNETRRPPYQWSLGAAGGPASPCTVGANVPAAHWWLSGNVKLGLIWGSVVHCDVFVLVCCAFCMLGNVHLMFLEVLDTHLVKVQGGGYFFWRRLS